MRDLMRVLWGGWKAVATRIGHFQTRVILSLFYYVLMLPVAVGMRLFRDPLQLNRETAGTRWTTRDHVTLSLKEATRQ